MGADTFTCDACGETFPKAWSDEEAIAEHIEIFGFEPEDDHAVICDDCFQRGKPNLMAELEMERAWRAMFNSIFLGALPEREGVTLKGEQRPGKMTRPLIPLSKGSFGDSASDELGRAFLEELRATAAHISKWRVSTTRRGK